MNGSTRLRRQAIHAASAVALVLAMAAVPLKPAAADHDWHRHGGWYGGGGFSFGIYGAPGYYYAPPPPPVYYQPAPVYYAPPPPVYYPPPPPVYYGPPSVGFSINVPLGGHYGRY